MHAHLIVEANITDNLSPLLYQVEGIGKKFVPANYDVTVTDKWYKTDDAEGFEYARKLVKLEGLLCGESCDLVSCDLAIIVYIQVDRVVVQYLVLLELSKILD